MEKADAKLTKWKSQEEALKSEEDIAESGRIFVRNLAYTTTEKDLEDLFSSYGKSVCINHKLVRRILNFRHPNRGKSTN